MLMLSVFVQIIQSSKHPNILLKFVLLHILFSYLFHTAGAAILKVRSYHPTCLFDLIDGMLKRSPLLDRMGL